MARKAKDKSGKDDPVNDSVRDENGNSPEASNSVSVEELDKKLGKKLRKELGDARLIKMFEEMVLLRRFEEQAGRAYQRRQIKGFCHLYIGQEAVGVGAMSALSDDDYVVSHYREHGHALARGMDPHSIMAELFGKAEGCSKGKGGSMHLFDVDRKFYGGWGIVGGQVALATGIAFASKYRDEKAVCLGFFGEGAIHQGIMHESFNMAALWGLPAVYIIENNRYAMGTSLERASAVTDLKKKALAYDMEGVTVDGQDIFAVYTEVKKAVDRAREENRPTLMDIKTYRYRGHSMTDPGNYRQKEELEQEQDLRDPIVRLRNWLVEEKLCTQEEINAIDDEMVKVVKASVEFAENAPFPDPETLTQDVYVHWPWEME